jgi:hypothetical protein
LFIIEESKAILGWDSIQDFIRNEEYKRRRPSGNQSQFSGDGTGSETLSDTPLSNLSDEEFHKLKDFYTRFAIPAKVTLIILTLLTLLWDLMIVMTAIYFHVMIEKVIGGLAAVLMWFLTYQGFYTMNSDISPGLPGLGLFKYSNHHNQKLPVLLGRPGPSGKIGVATTSKGKTKESPDDVPNFMGMPLYALRKKPEASFEPVLGLGNSF